MDTLQSLVKAGEVLESAKTPDQKLNALKFLELARKKHKIDKLTPSQFNLIYHGMLLRRFHKTHQIIRKEENVQHPTSFARAHGA